MKQLTFADNIIEDELAEFENTGELKYYKSAKDRSKIENSTHIFNSIKRSLLKDKKLALKINLIDGSFFKCIELLSKNDFNENEIFDTIYYIYKHTNIEELEELNKIALNELLSFTFIDVNTTNNISDITEKNTFIKILLSYFILKKLTNINQIEIWEKDLEKQFNNNPDLIEEYYKYWNIIDNYYKDKD